MVSQLRCQRHLQSKATSLWTLAVKWFVPDGWGAVFWAPGSKVGFYEENPATLKWKEGGMVFDKAIFNIEFQL